MSLSDEINALSNPGRTCRTCAWYELQDDAVKTAFDSYIARQAQATQPVYKPLWRLCTSNGLKVSDKAFRDHIHNCHSKALV